MITRAALVFLTGFAIPFMVPNGELTFPEREPSVLVVHPEVVNRLNALAAGLHRELAACLHGTVRGDTAYVDNFSIPHVYLSTRVRALFAGCPQGTIAAWHNHPPLTFLLPATCDPMDVGGTGCEGTQILVAADAHAFCAMSTTDRKSARVSRLPFYIVQVSPATVCWWRMSEAIADTLTLPAARGQRTW